LVDSRHAVVERLVPAGGFVPNDVRLDASGEQLLLVTGPNMAGKSTLIRQVALSVVLAQMGSFGPARAARLGIRDRVFTRVGAREGQGDVVFLRKLVPGGASRSFGVEVAKLAGLPPEVVARARAILETLEGDRASPAGPRPAAPGKGEGPQLGLFEGRGDDPR